MTLIILYVATFVIFLGIDYFGLSYIIKPIFEANIGHLMLEEFRVLPAFAFYAFLVGIILWFVSWPALQHDKSVWWVLGNAALIGAAGYGTYEFTSLAIMKDWSWGMALTDFVWGTCLTAVAATGGVLITRALT
jgi:uncharacterized membrane protein